MKDAPPPPPKEAPSASSHSSAGNGPGGGKAAGKGAMDGTHNGERKQFPIPGDRARGYTPEEVLACMPPVENATITARHESLWHLRWRIHYSGHGGTSKTHKDLGDELDSVGAIVRWAWRIYESDGGTAQCPFDFSFLGL